MNNLDSRHLKRIISLLVSMGLVWGLNCSAPRNYISLDSPKFTGNYARAADASNDTLKVVSFNIKFAKKIKKAISELQTQPELQNADIILLQEMDESGTDSIAKSLSYNYVYYPATVHPQSDRNFGNAILSKWPLHSQKKILLPYEPVLGKTKRIAVSSYVAYPKHDLLVYSVHTATAVVSAEKRLSQADSILNSISKQHPQMIIGGDFNTLFSQNVRDLEDVFSKNGFFRASREAGATVEKVFFNLTLDHIFIKGLELIDSGTTETQASDHKPLWVLLRTVSDKKP